MPAVTADSLYQLLKQLEATFPLPAPYVTSTLAPSTPHRTHLRA